MSNIFKSIARFFSRQPMNKDLHCIFGDLETGGLNGIIDDNKTLGMIHYPIFEIALVVTNADLTPIGEPLHIVIHHDEESIAKSHAWAIKTHTE